MATAAFLARLAAQLRHAAGSNIKPNEGVRPPSRRSPIGAGVLSVPEIRTVLARLLFKSGAKLSFVITLSRWRRRHQAHATKAQYRQQQHAQL